MDRLICSKEHSVQRIAQMWFPNQTPFTPPEEDTATKPELPVSLARQPPGDTAINSIEVTTKDFFRWFPTIIQSVAHMYGIVAEQQTSLNKRSKNTTWFQHRPPHHHSPERGKGLPKVKMKH
jgi:hypothetical protein